MYRKVILCSELTHWQWLMPPQLYSACTRSRTILIGAPGRGNPVQRTIARLLNGAVALGRAFLEATDRKIEQRDRYKALARKVAQRTVQKNTDQK